MAELTFSGKKTDAGTDTETATNELTTTGQQASVKLYTVIV